MVPDRRILAFPVDPNTYESLRRWSGELTMRHGKTVSMAELCRRAIIKFAQDNGRYIEVFSSAANIDRPDPITASPPPVSPAAADPEQTSTEFDRLMSDLD